MLHCNFCQYVVCSLFGSTIFWNSVDKFIIALPPFVFLNIPLPVMWIPNMFSVFVDTVYFAFKVEAPLDRAVDWVTILNLF